MHSLENTLLTALAICLFSAWVICCLYIFPRAWWRKIRKTVTDPILSLLTESNQSTNFLLFRQKIEGIYKGRKISCYCNHQGNTLEICSMIHVQPGQKLPGYRPLFLCPKVLPEYRLRGAEIIYYKWFFSCENFDARKILDDLVSACEKVERNEFKT